MNTRQTMFALITSLCSLLVFSSCSTKCIINQAVELDSNSHSLNGKWDLSSENSFFLYENQQHPHQDFDDFSWTLKVIKFSNEGFGLGRYIQTFRNTATLKKVKADGHNLSHKEHNSVGSFAFRPGSEGKLKILFIDNDDESCFEGCLDPAGKMLKLIGHEISGPNDLTGFVSINFLNKVNSNVPESFDEDWRQIHKTTH